MPTTTNFGWTTPADTDLVKDGAAAIRTLGNGIDTSFLDLKGGTSGQVLAKNSNTDLDFVWVAQDDSNAIQNAIVDAKGDLITATAADTPARIAVGSNGQYLKADSTTATGLAWATLPASGKVLQVVSGTTSTAASSSTTTLADTGLTVTITPTSATSKVLLLVSHGLCGKGAGNQYNALDMKLNRGSTQILDLFQSFYTNTTLYFQMYFSFSHIDSPATTSATTYKTRFANNANAASVTVMEGNSTAQIIALEIEA